MKALLLLLLALLAPPVYAELYKCTTATHKTAYQDKPCQTTQTQTTIAPLPRISPPKPVPVPVLPTSTPDTIVRDEHGRIKRSEKAKNDFKAAYPCPATGKRSGSCPDYVIDHIKPLACGGLDDPSNMQWQTIPAGKEKDSWERDDCQLPPPAIPAAVDNSDLPSDEAKNKRQFVRTGSRGGHYVLTRSGKKRYLKHR